MRKLFRKAMTVAGTVAMIGATVGSALAANFPEPFTSNSAVVVGSGAAPSDSTGASTILSKLNEAASASAGSGKTTLSGEGDKFQFKRSATAFHMGDAITSVYSSTIDDGELETLLADGTYSDTNNDEFDYTQKIVIDSGVSLGLFDDNDYKEDSPTVGFLIASDSTVLTYTLDFSDQPTLANMENTDLKIMGKEYYVLSVDTSTNQKITLLDAADSILVSEGETKTVTVDGTSYEISIVFVDSSKVKLKVNGETTNSIADGGTYKLKSGAYVGIKDILYSSKDTGVSKVELSIGKGKLILQDSSDVEMNDETINNLVATVTNSTTKLDKISLTWKADDDLFITEEQSITMPGFEAVTLSFTGLDYPAEEEISVDMSSDYVTLKNFPTEKSVDDIPLLYTDGTSFTYLGKDSSNQLVTTDGNSLTFDSDTDEMFIATYDDNSNSESYIMRATSFKVDNGVNKTTIQYRKDGTWVDAKKDGEVGDTFSVGNVDLNITAVNKAAHTVTIANNSVYTNFDTLYSKEGLKVFLPVDSLTGTTDGYINLSSTSTTAWNLTMVEEDKNENPASGDTFRIKIGLNGNSPKEPTVSDVIGEEEGFYEIGDTDKFRGFMDSALATELIWDKSNTDQKTMKVIYHGKEVAAGVWISAPSVTSSTSTETGIKTYKDTESDMFAGKNLVVVGGSAINKIAAELLGGEFRGPDFTAKTGVSAGGFLIQSFKRGDNTALLVAGYNAADTEKAVTYLVNNQDKVDTSVGKKYKGTSATEATLVVS